MIFKISVAKALQVLQCCSPLQAATLRALRRICLRQQRLSALLPLFNVPAAFLPVINRTQRSA
jgi:hypothetical protein